MMSEVQVIEKPKSIYEQTLDVIKAASLDEGVDAAKMKQLIELQIMAMDYQKQQDFDAAFIDLQEEMPIIVKRRTNNQTQSKYAALEDIIEQIRPSLKKHNFTVFFKPINTETMVGAQAVLRHRTGYTETADFMLPLDNIGIKGSVNKTNIHGAASSLTYAKRYALCALLGISTGDEDGNASLGMIRGLTQPQIERVTGLLSQCNDKTRNWFIAEYGAANKVPSNRFDKLCAQLHNAIINAEAQKKESEQDAC